MAQLYLFIRSLTPESYKAILSDPEQSRRLSDGLAYVDAMTAYYHTDRPPAPRAQTAAPDAVVATPSSPTDGVKVYNARQCIGAVVNGECHGSIMPDAAYHPTCHGQMINGMCTGPMF
jgi:hypothetical protein